MAKLGPGSKTDLVMAGLHKLPSPGKVATTVVQPESTMLAVGGVHDQSRPARQLIVSVASLLLLGSIQGFQTPGAHGGASGRLGLAGAATGGFLAPIHGTGQGGLGLQGGISGGFLAPIHGTGSTRLALAGSGSAAFTLPNQGAAAARLALGGTAWAALGTAGSSSRTLVTGGDAELRHGVQGGLAAQVPAPAGSAAGGFLAPVLGSATATWSLSGQSLGAQGTAGDSTGQPALTGSAWGGFYLGVAGPSLLTLGLGGSGAAGHGVAGQAATTLVGPDGSLGLSFLTPVAGQVQTDSPLWSGSITGSFLTPVAGQVQTSSPDPAGSAAGFFLAPVQGDTAASLVLVGADAAVQGVAGLTTAPLVLGGTGLASLATVLTGSGSLALAGQAFGSTSNVVLSAASGLLLAGSGSAHVIDYLGGSLLALAIPYGSGWAFRGCSGASAAAFTPAGSATAHATAYAGGSAGALALAGAGLGSAAGPGASGSGGSTLALTGTVAARQGVRGSGSAALHLAGTASGTALGSGGVSGTSAAALALAAPGLGGIGSSGSLSRNYLADMQTDIASSSFTTTINHDLADTTDGVANYYYDSYFLHGMATCAEATGDTGVMDSCVGYAMQMIGTAQTLVRNSISYTVFYPLVSGSPQQLNSFQATAALARIASIIHLNSSFASRYASQLTQIVAFVQSSVFDYWFDKQNGRYADPGSSWLGGDIPWLSPSLGGWGGYTCDLDVCDFVGMIAAWTYQVTGSAVHREYAQRIATGFRSHLSVVNGAYTWDPGLWPISANQNQTGYLDTSHANREPMMMVAMYEAGIEFTLADLQLMAGCLVNVIWNRSLTDPMFTNYIDGSNGIWDPDGIPADATPAWGLGNIYHGWNSLAKYHPTLRLIVTLAYDKIMAAYPGFSGLNASLTQNANTYGIMHLAGELARAYM